MRYLLDTNIISELRKKQPNENVVSWFNQIHPSQLYLSSLTIGEVRAGALKKAKTDKRSGDLLLKWVNNLVRDYQEQILGIDLEVSEEWANLLAIDSTNAIDSLLAAQAISMNLVLVTRNIKHFKMFDIKLLNPFED
jgi:predicted nucleic acid-binding protein